jgi:WD40 repeat protein
MSLSAGTRLGPYEVVDLVGAGGMGSVYRARDTRLGRYVALKVMRVDGARGAERLRRFETEARAVARLSHPNVLSVFDVGTHEGVPYLVLELLEGETLRQRLCRGPLVASEAAELARQACAGLQAAHARGIVHRDLKPENLFLTSEGLVKILDFGIAKLKSGDGDGSRGETETEDGALVGTLGYLSPEQARGVEADARSDVFALGAVLYESLSGRRAFAGASAAETVAAILQADPPPLETGSGPLPVGLERIVRRCLEKEPERRFQSAHDLGLALEAVTTGRVPVAPVEEQQAPYPGLRSFTETEAPRFFGREHEVGALWTKLGRRHLLALIGPSGAGKTSFVRAGLVPARPRGWTAIVSTPGTSPFLSLAQSLAAELAGDAEAVRELLRFEEADRAVASVARWRRGHTGALVVVDQFEELFTQNAPEVQERFAALLGRLASEADVRVLLSMRDDFLMRCHEHEALAPVFEELTPLGALSGEALRRALVEPARAAGYRFEDEGLVERMLGAVRGERGALPLLAFAAWRLWELRDRDRRLLTRESYEEIGGVSGALAQHAESVLERIGPERQALMRELFRNLVTSQGTRAVVEREELLSVWPDRGAAEAVLSELIDARLLTSYEVPGTEGQTGAHRVEIVHESLLAAWPRLVRWQAQDAEGALLRDQLKQAAHLWQEKGRPADLLWSGTPLREYELWRERYPGRLTALEEDFARAMVERARRRRRIQKVAIAATIVGLSAVAIVVSISRHQAVVSRQKAEASRLLTLGKLRLDDDPTEALAYAVRSLRTNDSPDAREFAVRALSQAPPAREMAVPGTGGRVPAFSPDGSWVATAGHSDVVLVFPQDGGAPLELSGHDQSPRGSVVAFWASERVLVAGLCCGLGHRVLVWSVPEGRRLREIEFGAPTQWQVAPGRLFAETIVHAGPGAGLADYSQMGSADPRHLRVWELPGGEERQLGEVRLEALGATASVFDPEGAAWLYASRGELLRLPLPIPTSGWRAERVVSTREGAPLYWGQWGVLTHDRSGHVLAWLSPNGTGTPPLVLEPPHSAPDECWPDATGRWLVNRSWEELRARLWDQKALPAARPLELERSGSWYLAAVDVHPAASWAVVSTQGTSHLTFWPLTHRFASVVDGYKGLRRPVAFSPDGRWLATVWFDDPKEGGRTIHVFPLPGSGEREIRTLALPETHLWTNLCYDPQGRYVFAVGNSDRVAIVPTDGAPARSLDRFSEDTLLDGCGVSPSGRRVATAFLYGKGEKTLRVWDVASGALRTYPLPGRDSGAPAGPKGYENGMAGFEFEDDDTLYTAGFAGFLRWNLKTGRHETLLAPPRETQGMVLAMSRDRSAALVFNATSLAVNDDGSVLQLWHRASGRFRALPLRRKESRTSAFAVHTAGTLAALADGDGAIGVWRLPDGPEHLLLGHQGPVTNLAFSPDGRWIASTGEDNTLRLWPVPDVAQPPLQSLPLDVLLAKLDSLTNIRVVPDPASRGGYKVELAPFPGWRDVPSW